MELNKNYTTIQGTDPANTIDTKNQAQMGEIEADMTTIEGHLTDSIAHLARTDNPHTVTADQVGKDTAQWNASKIQGKTVDIAAIGAGKVVAYNEVEDKLVFIEPTAPGAHASNHITGGADVIPNAVAGGASGLMSGADKNKLNSVYTPGTNDVPISDGGTGSSTAAGAFANLKQAANSTTTGVVELATTAETLTGTDATRCVTPDAYRDAFMDTQEEILTAATETTTPADANLLSLMVGGVLTKFSWANLKATLKTYFDSLATTYTNKTITDTSNLVSAVTLYNPYKFYAYRTAAWTTANNAFGKVQFNAELFDTGNNFDAVTNYRFTAPVAGFYQFNGCAGAAGLKTCIVSLFKNGVDFARGSDHRNNEAAGLTGGSHVSSLIQLAANDYVELHLFANVAAVGNTADGTVYFNGYLVSRT